MSRKRSSRKTTIKLKKEDIEKIGKITILLKKLFTK